MNKIYTVSNQKGGCGKTTLTLNLGASLAEKGKKVCLIDCDPQANLTMALGFPQPDELPVTIANVISELLSVKGETSNFLKDREYIMQAKGMDFIPSGIDLAGMENILINAVSRENMLKKLVKFIRNDYDYILIDTMPSLNFITINALNAADSVIIPTQPQYFSAKGLEMLLQTISNVRENLNPHLSIEGIVVTMYDGRFRLHREISETMREFYGGHLRIFETKIPMSVKVSESQAYSATVLEHDTRGRVAESYRLFADELIGSSII